MSTILSGTYETHHPSFVVPSEPVWQLSVEQYHEMIRTGILTEDDPVELLDGWLVTKMPKKRTHSIATGRTREMLAAVAPVGWYVDAREPITLSRSEPEPDVLVVRGDRAQYPDAPPGPEDVALIVEVADSTLRRDRTTKKRLYAEAGIPIYWIVNLIDRQIEVYRNPSGPAEDPDYDSPRYCRLGEHVPLVIEGREVASIAVADMLP
jgi:Uma2 family endonuclease